MAITIHKRAKLSKEDLFVVNWLNEHNIKGSLARKRGAAIRSFYLRKTGMTTHFYCEIHYKKVNLLQYLEHLDKALTERVEQEENAKQCVILAKRIKHLLNLDDIFTIRFVDYLDELEEFNDITVTDEILKLRDEYHRLFPKRHAYTYKDGNDRIYAEWTYNSDDSFKFNYWKHFMYDMMWRLDTVEYIPVYHEC